jgi:hypothetical protein
MGARLQSIVDRVRRESRGVVNVDLARLNLRVGQPLSRMALDLPDTPELLSKAELAASEILRESNGGTTR